MKAAGSTAGGRGSYRRVPATEMGPDVILLRSASAGGGGGARNKRWWRGSGQPGLEMTSARVWPFSAATSLAFTLICFIVYLSIGGYSREEGGESIHSSNRSSLPSIAVFAAPRADSSFRRHTEMAVRSWLALSPNVSVVLFGHGPSLVDFAGALGPRVSVESAIDFTFTGAALFHSMVARAQASNSDVSVLIDPETILFPDFILAVQTALHLKRDWLLVAIPQSFSPTSFNLRGGGGIRLAELQKKITSARSSRSSDCGDRAVIAWNRGSLTPQSIVIPPFIHGKGLHNQWLIHEALSSELRLVIDAGASVTSFYPQASGGEETWERSINAKLAASFGSFHFRPKENGNLVALVECAGRRLLYSSAEDTLYGGLGRPRLSERRWRDCTEQHERRCSVAEWLRPRLESPERTPAAGLPFSLESLLRRTADENRTVVLGIAGNNYRDMLMSWACRLRRLSVTNFLVGAIDADLYDFAVLQGLPVFMDPQAPAEIGQRSCLFGTKCFSGVTKAKSRLVLGIISMGYNVLMSDVDVYWFQNPLPFLRAFEPPVLLAQSDEFNETGPINLPHRLNSGFYYARADRPTIAALAKVVERAAASALSEQPSFYKVLCGEGGAYRTSATRCLEPETNLTTVFLDRKLFPNGAYLGLWDERDVRSACAALGCLVLHNNWLSGRDKKVRRQIASKLWAYDVQSRMCLHDP